MASAAIPYALPRAIPLAYGLRVYGLLDRFAPAPYVEATLSTVALSQGDLDSAERYALRLPPIPVRNELLARIAQARGEPKLALEYYLVVPDVNVVQSSVFVLKHTDPDAAYVLESTLRDRLEALLTHPDSVAEAYWMLGLLAGDRAAAHPAQRREFLRLGLQNFQKAIELSPFSEKYLLAAGNESLALGDLSEARRDFSGALEVQPSSADAYVGLGTVSLRAGDTISALRYARRARRLDPAAPMLPALERALR